MRIRSFGLAMIMAAVGVIFSAGPASAADPQCLRAFEAAGPCADELSFPTTFPAKPLHGMIFLIASGGWQSQQPYLVAPDNIYRQASNRWLSRGYAVAMVEHSDAYDVTPNTATGPTGVDNVLQWYDIYRAFWDGLEGYGPNFPICASGFSSGGHMALMLGAKRPSLDCIVVEAPPSRINYTPKRDGSPTHAPALQQDVQYLADRAFSGTQGVSPAPSWSPLTLRQQITMPVLVGHANNDKLVLVGQTKTFCVSSGAFHCQAVYLTASKVGPVDFTHANVNDAALANFRATEQTFVCSIVSAFTGPCP